MKNSDINQRTIVSTVAIIIILIGAVGFASMIGKGNVRLPAAFFVGAVFLAVAPRFYPILLGLSIPFSLLGGAIGFLYRFTPFHVVAGAGIAGWFIANFFRLNQRWEVSKGCVAFNLAVFWLCGAFIVHMIRIRFDPSAGFGGLRIGVAASLILAFLLLSRVYNLPDRIWKMLPVLALLPTGFATFLDLLSLFAPSTILFTQGIYVGASEITTGAASAAYAGPLTRIVPFREFGLCLALLGSVNLGITRLNSFKGLAARALVPLGMGITLMSGFRGYTVTVFCLVVIAFYIRYRFLTVVPLAILSFLVFVLVVGQGQFLNLPLSAQRALSFLPGDWDASMKAGADEGYNFRQELWYRYWDNFDESKTLFGKGQSVDLAPGSVNARQLNEDAFFQFFIDSQNYHNGFLSTFDMTGVFGVLALAFVNIYVAYLCFGIFLRDRRMPAYVLWLMLLCISPWPRFWLNGFLDIHMPFLLMPAIALSMVWRYRYNCGRRGWREKLAATSAEPKRAEISRQRQLHTV